MTITLATSTAFETAVETLSWDLDGAGVVSEVSSAGNFSTISGNLPGAATTGLLSLSAWDLTGSSYPDALSSSTDSAVTELTYIGAAIAGPTFDGSVWDTSGLTQVILKSNGSRVMPGPTNSQWTLNEIMLLTVKAPSNQDVELSFDLGVSVFSYNGTDGTLDGVINTDDGLATSETIALGAGSSIQLALFNNDNILAGKNGKGIKTLTLTAVPEPSTYAILLGLSAFGFVMVRRRMRK
jgi:hypothetical protein